MIVGKNRNVRATAVWLSKKTIGKKNYLHKNAMCVPSLTVIYKCNETSTVSFSSELYVII